MSKKADTKFIKVWAKKLACIEKLGGKCEECGKNLIEEPWEADFHHKNSNQKKFQISLAIHCGYSLKSISEELSKCNLLCRSCHNKEHVNLQKYFEFKNEILKKSKSLDWNCDYFRTKQEETKIVDLLKKGNTLQEVAKKVGRSIPTIKRVAVKYENKLNIKLYKTTEDYNENRRKITDEQLKKEKENGLSLQEIAKKYDMEYKTVWKRNKKL